MSTNTITSFGLWLKQHRRALDLTQQDLARRVGCSLETIVKIEAGERRPSKQVAERLAECLNVPSDERSAFVQYARVETSTSQPLVITQADDRAPWRTLRHFHHLHTYPNNLPAQPNPFIGRDKQVAAANRLLRRPGVRLVSMTGPPGVGKTRLSLQVVTDLLNEFDSGVYFVALAPITDPRLVAPAIARTLGVREAGRRPILDSLKSFLRDKRILLVLDNFEQVVPAASLVAELVATAPLLKVLVTSRSALHIYGEYELRIPPLALPDRRQEPSVERLMDYEATELFTERALAANPEFSLAKDNASAVSEICHLLDGLPLAIELAASRVRFLAPQAILARLESKGFGGLGGAMRLLVGGPTNLPARQRTLRAAIAWSYDLLDAEEQQLFRTLSVFVGGCTLEAITRILDFGFWILDTAADVRQEQIQNPKSKIQNHLDSLVDKCLLRHEEQAGVSRYWMLETISEYGLERLAESGEMEAVYGRYVEYYLALAEQAEPELRGPDQRLWLDRLESEHDNLRAALRWSERAGDLETGLRLAGALGWFWFRRGHFSEGRRWLDEFLAHKDQSSDEGRRTKDEYASFVLRPSSFVSSVAKARNAAGRLADHQGDYVSARTLYEESRQIYEELGDTRSVGYALCGLGFTNLREGNRDRATRLYEHALSLFSELGDKRGIATSIRGLADLALHEGDYGRARSLYEDSLVLFQELGDKYIIATSLNGLGNVALDQRDYAQARTRYEDSLAIFRQLEDRYGIAGSLLSMGEVFRCLGDYEAAYPMYEESLEMWKALGEKWNLAMTLHNLGHVVHHQGNYAQASAIFAESLALFREAGAKVGIAMCIAGLAGVLGVKHPDRAVRLFGLSEALLEAAGVPLQAADLDDYEHNLAAARASLSEGAFASAWEEGHTMTIEQAIIYALAQGVAR